MRIDAHPSPGMWVLLLCSLLAVPGFPVPLTAEDQSVIVDQVVAAYGGADKVRMLEAFRLEGTVEARLRGKSGRVRRDFRGPGSLLVEIAYPDGKETRLLLEDAAFRGMENRLAPVSGPPRLAMVYQMLRAPLPLSLERYRSRLKMQGTTERGGNRYIVLGLEWSDQLRVRFMVNEETRRVERVEGDIVVGPATIPFATDYDDFRMVDGVLVPFREKNFARGYQTGLTTVTAVTFAPEDLGPFSVP